MLTNGRTWHLSCFGFQKKPHTLVEIRPVNVIIYNGSLVTKLCKSQWRYATHSWNSGAKPATFCLMCSCFPCCSWRVGQTQGLAVGEARSYITDYAVWIAAAWKHPWLRWRNGVTFFPFVSPSLSDSFQWALANLKNKMSPFSNLLKMTSNSDHHQVALQRHASHYREETNRIPCRRALRAGLTCSWHWSFCTASSNCVDFFFW